MPNLKNQTIISIDSDNVFENGNIHQFGVFREMRTNLKYKQ